MTLKWDPDPEPELELEAFEFKPACERCGAKPAWTSTSRS